MKWFFRTAAVVGTVALVAFRADAQSGREYRRSAIMNGNQVRTVFGNWGVIGQPGEQGSRGSWKNPNNGYLGDVSPMVGAEVRWDTTVFHSVVTTPVSRPTQIRDEDPQTGKSWTFEPVGGYFNANQQKVAISTDRNSWPLSWPDKLSDAVDPGWRGSWNGYFGKRVSADQETYYVMDDNNDERFNIPNRNLFGIAFRADSTRPARYGLALDVRIRGLQWAQFLAKDNIFWLYEITNTGTTDYDRVVFGMIVGTYVGVTSTEDFREYSDDWSFYSAKENITYTGDYGRSISNPLFSGPVGMVGYAFLESPGNPFDGIDNDGDAEFVAEAAGASFFTQTSFDTTTITSGMQIVLIANDFSRSVYAVPAADSVLVTTRGLTRMIYPNTTRVVEGNILTDVQGNKYVNPNAYDGVDNDYDGLVDENYYVHYRQLKQTRTIPPVTLIDQTDPVKYINYVTGQGTSPLSMIDELRTDRVDNDKDWNVAFDDVGRDGINGTGDFGEGDAQATSGIDNLGNDTGLPGEPHIDKTDVSESDQIGLTSFFYFVPSNNVRLGDDESLWRNLAPGYFDVPTSIVINKPQAGEDGDFIYGSGYFPLLAGKTERFSLALVYGGGRGGTIDNDVADLLKNKKTVQKIYDANYQFPQPPELPTLVAVPSDKKVTLYWDRFAEKSVDPVLLTQDFEGYKLYKSTDPNFSDIFTITDGSGTPQGYTPLKQYDLKNSVKGYFHADDSLYEDISGFAYFLGGDNGLQHTYVDEEVENGKRYFYALVAYDRGDEVLQVLPSENTKFVAISTSGEVSHDRNVAVVTPNAKGGGYVAAAGGVTLDHPVRYATGSVTYQLLDPTRITGHTYRIEFDDTQNDGIDNNANGLIDAADSSESTRTTTFYSVRDLSDITETFVGLDTAIVALGKTNQIPSTVVVKNSSGNTVPSANYSLNTIRGTIRGTSGGSLPSGTYTITYQYFPIYRSPNMQGTPYLNESFDTDIFDGVQLSFSNSWSAVKIDTLSKWTNTDPYRYNMSPLLTQVGPKTFAGIRKPSNYRVEFASTVVDTSVADPDLWPDTTHVNFRVYNETDSTYIDFLFADLDGNKVVSSLDGIVFIEKEPLGGNQFTWSLSFVNKLTDPPGTVYPLTDGDTLILRTTIPFRKEDVLEFTTEKASIDQKQATAELLNVKVVPNPYVTAAEFEPPLNPGVTRGRGQRRIDFTHVPVGAVINIFTSRGDHVVTLRHDGNMENGTVSWNLKTKENLDIAFGVYFYVVQSPVGNKTGKIAIIK